MKNDLIWIKQISTQILSPSGQWIISSCSWICANGSLQSVSVHSWYLSVQGQNLWQGKWNGPRPILLTLICARADSREPAGFIKVWFNCQRFISTGQTLTLPPDLSERLNRTKLISLYNHKVIYLVVQTAILLLPKAWFCLWHIQYIISNNLKYLPETTEPVAKIYIL